MSDQEIRDSKNQYIGYTKDYSDKIIAYHYQHGYVGYYSKATDLTFDERGNIFCHGDGSQTLVRNFNIENKK